MQNPRIIRPYNCVIQPHELDISKILLTHFTDDIIFLRPLQNKTPDFLIKGQYWELKTPVGNGRHTIENLLRKASKQSQNIILDLSKTAMSTTEATHAILKQAYKAHRFKKVLLITKSKTVIDILPQK